MTSVLTRSATDIVNKALELLRVKDPEGPLNEADRKTGVDSLNGLIKYLQIPFHLWTEEQAFLALEKGKVKYSLGPGGDRAFMEDDAVFTTLSADASTGDTTVTLTNDTDIMSAPDILNFNPTVSTQDWTITDATVVADNTGFVMTNAGGKGTADYDVETEAGRTYIFVIQYVKGTSSFATFEARDINGVVSSTTASNDGEVRLEFTARQSTTIFRFENSSNINGEDNTITNLNYIDKSTGDSIGIFLDDNSVQWTNVIFRDPITLADALTGDAVSGNTVYSYTDLINRPLDVTNTRYRDKYNATDIPTTEWTRKEYFEQPDKTTQGIVTKWYYRPRLTTGELYVWGAPSNNANILAISYIDPLDITQDNADIVDFPSEWYMPLSYMLAKEVGTEYSVSDARYQQIVLKADEYKQDVLGNDNEDTSISIEPSFRE